MRVLIQRVSQAAVTVDHRIIGQIDTGLLVLLGIESEDTMEDIDWLTGKIVRLRIFRDQAGAMNCSVQDIGGEILVVSQFTLFASTKKGNRPSFIRAADPEFADQMYRLFCQSLETLFKKPVHRGIFGARMFVQLVNDGPVTVWIDSKNRD
jgi:D-aminoacyl-tRNA deacylase